LGVLLDEACRAYGSLSEIDLIVPVPLHPGRLRSRGFNQAYLLVHDWLKSKRQKGVSPLPVLKSNALIRLRNTLPQTGLTYQQRQHNVRKAFHCPQPNGLADKHVLLVDDVFTTGATADACARMLVKAGARVVDVLTVARALPEVADRGAMD
jgi:ComF family protein